VHQFTNGQLALFTIEMVVVGVLLGVVGMGLYFEKRIEQFKETIERKNRLVETLDCRNQEERDGLVPPQMARAHVAKDEDIL